MAGNVEGIGTLVGPRNVGALASHLNTYVVNSSHINVWGGADGANGQVSCGVQTKDALDAIQNASLNKVLGAVPGFFSGLENQSYFAAQ